jgi:choice-of-anchor B domain-containing protein
MPLNSRRLRTAVAAAMVGMLAIPALAHDGDKGNAGGGGPTPPGLGSGDFSSYRVSMLSRMNLDDLAAPGADTGQMLASAWGWVDPLTNSEYALVARRSDLAIVDITVPTAPVLIGNVQRTAGTNPTVWRDVRVVGNWAFIGVDSANHGIQAFDLTRVRGVATPTLFAADAVFDGISNTHTLATNFSQTTPYIYAPGSNTINGLSNAPDTPGGMQILDVSNPLSMSIAASWQDDGYIHESSIFTYTGPDADHQNKQLSFNATGYGTDPTGSPNSFSIVDVSNPAALARISQAQYANTGYAHQGWLTEDQRYFFVDDELDELNHVTGEKTRTHMYDVSDLDNPVYRGFVEWGTGNIDHNLYIKDGFIFQANYTRGLRVFELGDLESTDPQDWFQEVAWFDSYPADDSVTFNGAWQVYPYFPSGSIIISDINGGLFTVQVVPEPASVGLLAGLGCLALLRRRRQQLG